MPYSRSLFALAIGAALTAPAPAAVKGRPADPYKPLGDWSGATFLLKADPATLGQFETEYAKVTAVSARAEPDRVLFRVRLEKPLDTYFAALEPNRLVSPYGVSFALMIDADADDATGSPSPGPDRGTDLVVMVHGVTNSDATYRMLAAYRPDDEPDPPPKTRGSLSVERGEIAYGADAVEIALPKAALPRLGRALEVFVYQSVKVGDRAAAELRGRWVLSPGGAATAPVGGKAAGEPSPVARPATPEAKAAAAAAFARFMQAMEKNDRSSAEKLAEELKSMGPATVAVMEERVRAGSKNDRGMALMILRDFKEISAPALPAILEASRDKDDDIRGVAAWTIGSVDKSEASLRRLVELLKDPSAVVRWRAADSLGEFGAGGAAAVPALAVAALDPVEDVNRSAVSALGKIRSRPEVAIPALVKALDVQTLGAVGALAAFGAEARPAVPALVELAKKRAAKGEDNDWLGHDVAVALAAIGGPETKQALPSLETLHSRMTSVNFKQDLADAIYKIKALK